MNPGTHRRQAERRGAVLLEVILALAIFVAAAGVITGMLSTSIGAVDRLREEATAADLMVTVQSELAAGIREARDEGPSPFDDEALSDWTWQVTVTALPTGEVPSSPAGEIKSVEVAIQNAITGYTVQHTSLLPQWTGNTADTATSAAGGGP